MATAGKKSTKSALGRKRAAAAFSFNAAIRHLHPGQSVGSYAKSVLNGMAIGLASRITMNAADLTMAAKKKTISEKAVMEAAQMMSTDGGDMGHILTDNTKGLVKKYEVPSMKSQLVFHPARVARLMRSLTSLRLSRDAYIWVAAYVQIAMLHLINAARNQLKHYNHERKHKVVRMTSKFIGLALSHNEGLHELFLHGTHAVLRGAPSLHSSSHPIVPKPKKAKKTKKAASPKPAKKAKKSKKTKGKGKKKATKKGKKFTEAAAFLARPAPRRAPSKQTAAQRLQRLQRQLAY